MLTLRLFVSAEAPAEAQHRRRRRSSTIGGWGAPGGSPLPPAPSPAPRREGENPGRARSGVRAPAGRPSPGPCPRKLRAERGENPAAPPAPLPHLHSASRPTIPRVPHGTRPCRTCRRRPTSRVRCREFIRRVRMRGIPSRPSPTPAGHRSSARTGFGSRGCGHARDGRSFGRRQRAGTGWDRRASLRKSTGEGSPRGAGTPGTTIERAPERVRRALGRGENDEAQWARRAFTSSSLVILLRPAIFFFFAMLYSSSRVRSS